MHINKGSLECFQYNNNSKFALHFTHHRFKLTLVVGDHIIPSTSMHRRVIVVILSVDLSTSDLSDRLVSNLE